jgi:hypothetical protein
MRMRSSSVILACTVALVLAAPASAGADLLGLEQQTKSLLAATTGLIGGLIGGAAGQPPAPGGEPVGGVSAGPPTPVQTVNPLLTAPSSAGQWQVLPYDVPGLAVHATVLNDGRVLLVEGSGSNAAQFAAGTFNVYVWDPQAGTFTNVPRLPTDLFCGGHAVLRDGKVLFVGGTSAYPTAKLNAFLGSKATYVFDPATNSFTRQPDMASARWYPSALERGDGSVLAVTGGNDVDGTAISQAEVFDPSAGTWSRLPGQRWFPYYPSLTLLQTGQVFYSGSAAGDSNWHPPGVWDPASNAFAVAPSPSDPAKRDQGASLLLPPAQRQRIGVFGGGVATAGGPAAVSDADLYDLSNPAAPTHSIGLPMAAAKMHVLGVTLPDETVFETGGGQRFATDAVLEAADYDPSTGLWAQMNPPTVPRTYHSEAILLPDGRVATFGSNPLGFKPELRIELFSPPYLFNGPRPTIDSAPSNAAYGSSYPVTVSVASGAALKRLVLIKPASVTHSADPNQRLVELPFGGAGGAGGAFTATVPASPNLTPPGWYMLFALDDKGRPSVAHWVRVG